MHFEQRDAIALLAVPLIVAAFKAENAVFATLCLSLAAALVIFALARHDELPWKQRFALGALIFVADLATVFYLYRVNAARELRAVITEFPHVVFTAHGNVVLRIDRAASDLLISFRVFNDRGILVARLDRNTFAAENSASHVERPDASHLIVFDDRGTQVLDVQFLNPQAIKMTGILRYPGIDPIIVSEKFAGRGGSIMPQSCSTGTEPDFEGK